MEYKFALRQNQMLISKEKTKTKNNKKETVKLQQKNIYI